MPALPAKATDFADTLVAMADQCVQCGLCLPHCPTYRLDASEAESPRGRIAYIKALASGFLKPSADGDNHLDHCLGCRRCEAACPAGVPYESLLIAARQQQRLRAPLDLPTRWRLALLSRPGLLREMLGIYRRIYPILRQGWRPLPRPDRPSPSPATTKGEDDVALFVGCIAGTYESAARASLIALLAAVGVRTRTPQMQTCCGTAARHAGLTAQAESLATDNRRAFSGAPRVLTLASGCEDTLRQSLGGTALVQDALGFIASRSESLRFRSAEGRRVALHLPCSQRVNRSDAALRGLLARVPDLDLVELLDTGCCGAAGLHMLAEPARAAALRAPVLKALADSGADELLSANIGCRLHLGNGTTLPLRHPVEFLAEHLA